MYTLLIVDDERDIREGLARYFPWESVGFTVEGTYEGGQQALERVAAGGSRHWNGWRSGASL